MLLIKYSITFLLIIISACSPHKEKVLGHWHEVLNGHTVHCYNISDTLVSVDEFTHGYSRQITNGNVFEPLITESTFEYLKGETSINDQINIGDSVKWIKVANSGFFIEDMSIGLLVSIEPPELNQLNYDLNYKLLNDSIIETRIFIGQQKSGIDTIKTSKQFKIQLNDVIADVSDIDYFVPSHLPNDQNKIIMIHADKNTPLDLFDWVVNEIIKAGYSPSQIFRTAIEKDKKTIGLVRVYKTTGSKSDKQLRVDQ